MKLEDMVPLTLFCFMCREERVVHVPRKRKVSPGKYDWECFSCQEKRQGRIGKEPSEQEES